MTVVQAGGAGKGPDKEREQRPSQREGDVSAVIARAGGMRMRDLPSEEVEAGRAFIRSMRSSRVPAPADDETPEDTAEVGAEPRTRRSLAAQRMAMREGQAEDDAESRFNVEVGERLRHVREVLGLALNEVASKLNVTRQTLSNYESGRTPLRASVIRELAEIYEISCDWILGTHDQIEINFSSNGRTLYMRETSPRIYPASVKNDADRQKWDEAQAAKEAELARMEDIAF